ncbi:MAG: AbrB family transcriptional regulator [Paracoccaceae bacterium]
MTKSKTTSVYRYRLETVTYATAGAALFYLVGAPLPFLFGPMAACLLAALLQRPLVGLGQLSVAARTVLGVAVGASLTPEVVSQLPQMAASVALIPLYIIVIALIGVPFFHRFCGFDLPTAWYAAMPGGLQDMVIFGQEAGGDVRALSLIHATRVLIVVTIAPAVLVFGFGASLDAPIGAPASSLPLHEMALVVAAALIGWKGGEKIGLFGASIIGPMAVTAVLSLSGLIHTRPPAEAILAAQFMIGLGIGVGYVGVTAAELRKNVLAGIMYAVILAFLAAGFTWVVISAKLANPVEGFLSFAPGGQAEMTVLSIVAGADLGFVIVHHLTRVFLVITGAPLAARWLMKRQKTR